MKKRLKSIIVVLIILVIGVLGYIITIKLNHNREITEQVKMIPDFSFETLEGEIFTQKSLKQLSTVFIYFNSECESCSLETIKLKKRLTDFKNKEIIFISYENKDSILKFARKHQLYNKENIRFLEDKKGVFSQIFNIETIPYIFVYDRERQLKGKFKGITKIDKILEALK